MAELNAQLSVPINVRLNGTDIIDKARAVLNKGYTHAEIYKAGIDVLLSTEKK